jgi:hypothetical protein
MAVAVSLSSMISAFWMIIFSIMGLAGVTIKYVKIIKFSGGN